MDLNKEFIRLINQNVGHWVLIRNFTNEYSEYWDEITKEAVGGPMYKYVDKLARTYSAPLVLGGAKMGDGVIRTEPGDIPTDTRMYFFKSEVIVNMKDIIFELGWSKREKPMVVFPPEKDDISFNKVTPKSKSEVLKVVPFSADADGALDFIKVFAKEDILT